MMQRKDSDTEHLHGRAQNPKDSSLDQEAFFRAIFENNSAAIAIIEADMTVSMVNNAFCEMCGYSEEELIGTKWTERIPPEEAKRMKEYNQQRFIDSANVPNKYEFTFFTKSGELRHGLVSVSILKSNNKAIASFADITKQKQTEEAYRLSEEKFRSLIEHASDVVYTLTSEGIITYTSSNWTEQLGHDLSEVIGHSFAKFVHPNDIERLHALIVQNFLTGEKLTNVEYQISQKNGQWRWFSSSSSPILDSNGKVTTLIGIAHDITKRKQTEEALQKSEALLNTLINTIPDLIWLKDTNGVFLSCNTMFERFLGATGNEIIGKTDYDFVDHELADSFRKNDQIAMEKGGPSNNEEWITFADDGHSALLDTIKTPMYNPNGELIGVLGVSRDITERKKILSQFESTNALLSSVLESSPNVVMFALDKNYHYLTFNKKHKEIIQMIWGKEIAIGTNMMDVFGNHPDKEKAKANFDRALAGEYLSIVEEYGDEEKTRQFWQDYYSPIYSSRGEIIGITCFVLDISKLKRAEAALKESEYFFKESQNAAFIGSYKVDFMRGTWESSDVMDQIFGIDKNYSRNIQEGWTSLIHPEDRAFMQKQMIEDVITKHKPFNAEYRIIRKSDGEIRWVNGLGKVIVNDQGKVTSLIGTIMDISERKIAEQTILQSQQKL
ncbi:MAG TPA: PAS domain S-box protein, partial [Prolixibacteraceae bacterium]|nr:PAS domain S-box protein [Prolixibacteraceae bacterium]HPS12392.1 PAS domain S-box protein [Prolixibacteraceae bacterium]